jgi:uncharacterized protein involved in cysteine biosynthesis
MSTLADAPSIKDAFKLNIAKWLIARKQAKEESTRNRVHAWQTLMRVIWHLAGFSCLTVAGFYAHMIAGFAVAGFSCFLMSRLTTVTTVDTETVMNVNRPQRR